MSALDGKVAVVTGAGSGIGLASARRLAAEGARVVVVDLDADRGRAAADEVGGAFVRADVAEANDWRAVVAEAEERFGGVDVAHLNAGVMTGTADITELTDEQYRRIMRANVDGVVLGTRALVPRLAERGGGALVATASLAGLIAFAPDPIYTVTKHAVVGFVRSMAPQLADKAITINAVCPGIVDTPMLGDDGKAMLEQAGFPIIEPAAIADAVFGLLTGDATGHCVVIQAGREPTPFEFRGVPGPRAVGAEGMKPPPGMRDPTA